MTHPQFEPTPVEEVDGPTLLAIARLMEVRSEIETLQAEAKVLTMEIEKGLHRSTTLVGSDGQTWRATIVRPDPKVKVDLAALSRYPEIYARATKPMLDSEAFKRMAKAGVITREIVEHTCTFTPVSPSVRYVPFGEKEEYPDE
jgi:hypothetical protein